MTTKIIESVAYNKENAKTLLEKLVSLIGIQKLKVYLVSGDMIEGVLMEIGEDYLSLIENEYDILIPKSNISFVRFHR